MTGVSFTVDLDRAALGRAEDVLARLADADLSALVYRIGQLVENQTERRIATEKAGPDGQFWPAWSDRYARTRSERHSLLVGEGSLTGSIQNYTTGDSAVVGTNLIYGAIQQFGGNGIPARPYLGLSADNRSEIEDLVVALLDGMLA